MGSHITRAIYLVPHGFRVGPTGLYSYLTVQPTLSNHTFVRFRRLGDTSQERAGH